MGDDEDRGRIVDELWGDIRSFTVDNVGRWPAAARAIDAGAAPGDVVLAMTAAAYEATYQTLFRLTGEEDIAPLARTEALWMLHEDLLSADPMGQEGEDFLS